mgnify:CR=1 FL=1
MELVSEFKRIGVEHFTRWLGEHERVFAEGHVVLTEPTGELAWSTSPVGSVSTT